MLDRTVIKTIFKHVLVGPAYHRTRFDAQQLHNLVTIEIRPDCVEILLFLKVPYTLFHLIHGRRENHGLAAVLCGRIGTCQTIQTLIKRAGVLDVASYRGIGPRLLHIPMEA